MKFRLLWFVALATLFSSVAFSAPSKSSGCTVHVNGYTRKDGTYVAPYNRTAPNSTKNDNWSTKGNVNPETGKPGTKPGDSSYSSSTTALTRTGASSSSSPVTDATPSKMIPASPSQAAAPATVNLSKVTLGMTKAQVLAQTGEPNIKTELSWFYLDRGWVRFKEGTVVTGIEVR